MSSFRLLISSIFSKSRKAIIPLLMFQQPTFSSIGLAVIGTVIDFFGGSAVVEFDLDSGFWFENLLVAATEVTVANPSFFPFQLSFSLLPVPKVVWPPEKPALMRFVEHLVQLVWNCC